MRKKKGIIIIMYGTYKMIKHSTIRRVYETEDKEKFIKFLSDNKDFINSSDITTLLRLAVYQRKADWVKLLLEQGADPYSTQGHIKTYPLYEAFQYACDGKWEVLDAFQKSGVSLQKLGEHEHESNCSLVYSFLKGNIEFATYLISNGVKVSDYNSLMKSVLSEEFFNLLKDNPQIFSEYDLEKFEENKFNLLLSLS